MNTQCKSRDVGVKNCQCDHCRRLVLFAIGICEMVESDATGLRNVLGCCAPLVQNEEGVWICPLCGGEYENQQATVKHPRLKTKEETK